MRFAFVLDILAKSHTEVPATNTPNPRSPEKVYRPEYTNDVFVMFVIHLEDLHRNVISHSCSESVDVRLPIEK